MIFANPRQFSVAATVTITIGPANDSKREIDIVSNGCQLACLPEPREYIPVQDSAQISCLDVLSRLVLERKISNMYTLIT